MCHLVLFFPKIYNSGEEGALITFVYIQTRHPSTLLPLSLSNTFEGQGYCGWGVNRTGQRLKTTPAQFFFRCGLSFFRGKGWSAFFFLENYHYPFDLQVGPLLGTQGGGGGGERESWPLLDKS